MEQKEFVKQTGLLFRLDPNDFITGASPLIHPDINSLGDWTEFAPESEKQFKDFTFDTMSCTTFSAMNIIETWINWHIAHNNFTVLQLEEMSKLGFFKNGKFNASDRFTAIMSGTTPQGNYFQKVWDSVRKDGILPETDLPFGGNSWAEYHNPAVITAEMKQKAKKILDILEVSYEWTSFTPNDIESLKTNLKKSPIHGGIPIPAHHAVELISGNQRFDTYPPYFFNHDGIQYQMRVVVAVKKPIINTRLVTITRERGNSKETTGSLVAQNGQSTFTCKTLELPWLNNAQDISCIPTGEYKVKWAFSPRFFKYMYHLQNVKGRSGIRIHVGNYYTDIQGCILLGNGFKDLNKDNVLDIVNSKITVEAFQKFMGKEEFLLVIK